MKYSGENLREIMFPIGGIGSGSISLAGNGSLVDWEIFNRPNKGGLNPFSFFAVRAEYKNKRSVTRVLQGDWIRDLVGKYTMTHFKGYGYGPESSTLCALPHFKKVTFDGKFPIATLKFEDDKFPATVVLKGFNPFIPLDADNSSIPAAFFDIEIKSHCDSVKYSVALSVSNPFQKSENAEIKGENFSGVKLYFSEKDKKEKDYGDMTIAVSDKNTFTQEYWYRGGWEDKQSVFWREFSQGNLPPRHFDTPSNRDVATVGASEKLNSGEKSSFKFLISWNIPNCYNYWHPCKDKNGNDILWKNYYAVLFENSVASARYSFENWDNLYKKTQDFAKILHRSTLDKAVIDAVASNLSVLKSPTVMRLEDGTFYAWEGVHEKTGSCDGTCTHVWSYVYSLCFLFPELERSIRDTELKYDVDEKGALYFRTALPLGRGFSQNYAGPPTACVDGQMATIMKIYRDWKLTGNSQWLKDNWAKIKSVLEFAWHKDNPHKWDLDCDGILEGRQHHTLDVELFGPSSWLEGMYLGALKAASEMAAFCGEKDKSEEYLKLFENGYKYTKENLFNGKYFIQKFDITDKSYVERYNAPEYWNEEKGEVKYQICDGSLLDQMLGQWHSRLCGIGNVFDKEQIKTALKNMFKNNFKESVRELENMWRAFAINDDAGSVICDYPNGVYKPIIPICYCEECMTGMEYAFAGLLISEGFIDEGIKVVTALRNRFDGKRRNPFNEFECGSNYSRSMSSFALLPIFSGFEFDLPNKHIGFSPILSGNFSSFFSVGSGWGKFKRDKNGYCIDLYGGFLELSCVKLGGANDVKAVYIDGKKVEFTQSADEIHFEAKKAFNKLKFEV